MWLEVTGSGVEVSVALRDYIRRRLEFALGRFVRRIDRVSVRVADVNGPRGGVDKQCRVRVRLRGVSVVLVTEAHEELHAAIDRAAGRAGRTVARKLDRTRSARTLRISHAPA